MDRSSLQADLLSPDLASIRGVPCIAHATDVQRRFALVLAIDLAARQLTLRDPENNATVTIPFTGLRYLVLPGAVPIEDRRRLVTRVAQQRMKPCDKIVVRLIDGQKIDVGPHHGNADAHGLHLFQFGEDGRLSRMFIPASSVGRVESSEGEGNARELLVEAAAQACSNRAELEIFFDHGVAPTAVTVANRGSPARRRLTALLVRDNVVSEQQIEKAATLRAANHGKRIGQVLVEMGAVSEDELHVYLGKLFRMPYARLRHFDFDPKAVSLIKRNLARKLNAVPLLFYRDRLVVAVNDPSGVEAVELLKFASGRMILPVIATERDLAAAIERLYLSLSADHSLELGQLVARSAIADARADAATLPALEAAANEEPLVRLVNNMLSEAVRRRVSDIHVRPADDHLDLIYRIDGTLVPVASLPKEVHLSLVSRIKIMGSMDISERRLPQDGQIHFRSDDGPVDLRISIMPTVAGESVVIRVLNVKSGLKPVGELGFSQRDLSALQTMLDKSYGILLVTGPTGSGKSTTLYSCLGHLVKNNLNIITVEDPVEYRIPGIEQVQVRQEIGYTFANALRQILRHDPDAILVGEIRDQDTAEIAVKSALTGHIVLSTLHTNSAIGAITRLRNMGILSYLLGSTLLGVLAQRLVRTNCPQCMEEERIEPNVRRVMGVGESERFMKGRGCEDCNGTGYKGRTAVYELLRVTPAMAERITQNSESEILYQQALEDGMLPLTQHALQLARGHKTSLAEAYRVRLE